MKTFKIIVLSLFFYNIALHAENYLLNGGQKSTIKYKLIQNVAPTSETVTVDLTYVQPQTFESPTYKQVIKDFTISFSRQPDKTDEWVDERGNRIVKYLWSNPRKAFDVEVAMTAQNSVELKQIKTSAPFPLINIPENYKIYLKATEQVQVADQKIKTRAAELVKDTKTQFDAVQKILSWIIDHMHYVLTPAQYDAVYSLINGKGNCQNYSHLAAALMRSAGIPVRIVNGVTLKEPYNVNINNQILTLNMAQGRHSWIEVYFADLGWMPFDPQQTELFVSNRFIRAEVGLDNSETKNDGMVHWTRQKGSQAMLSFQESIEADFTDDMITLSGNKQNYGPGKLLLMPPVDAEFVAVKAEKIKKTAEFDPSLIQKLKFDKSFIYGNLEFPEGVNFAFIRETTESADGLTQKLEKNFLVETAEYVTSNNQYSQIFDLNKPIILKKIGLALHKFGGDGQIWIELREDDKGTPGAISAKSKPVDLRDLSLKPGYFWVDFDFSNQQLILTPDKYWIAIGYTGSPIINWFYSYGKPVGPITGTRYKSDEEDDWNKTLGFEFNYRVIGLTTQ